MQKKKKISKFSQIKIYPANPLKEIHSGNSKAMYNLNQQNQKWQQREREREKSDDGKARQFSIYKKFWDHMKIDQTKIHSNNLQAQISQFDLS